MNEVQIFDNPEFGKIRTVVIDDEPWFVGKDIAQVLGYTNTRKALADHVDDEDKGVTKCDTLGGMQELTVINESGLYSLILSSKLPKARQFKRWVTCDVLPAIRKHGIYATSETIESILADPDTGIRLLTALKEERTKRKELEVKNEEMKPKAIFADAVSESDSTILVRDLAKLLRQNGVKIGEHRLFNWMRNRGYVIKNSREPTQMAMELGLFVVIERTIQRGDGNPLVTRTTKVTGKGQQYFINKILTENEVVV